MTDYSTEKCKPIALTKLEDTAYYRLWRAASEATFDVHNVLKIVLGTEVKPDETSDEFPNWDRRHKLAREALITALKPAQQIRVISLKSAHEIWQRLADEYGKISELKSAQLNAKLRSLRKSSNTKIQDHIDEFERIQREIEFHSEAMAQSDVNIAFLISLGDSEVWKNYRNSNIHRAISMKTADLLAEVTLIDDSSTPPTNDSWDQARAFTTSFNGGYQGGHNRGGYRGGYRGRGNGSRGTAPYNPLRRERPALDPDICEGCKKSGHIVEECPLKCNYCHERGHLIEDCLKTRWVNEQCFSRRKNGNGNRGDVDYRPLFERLSVQK